MSKRIRYRGTRQARGSHHRLQADPILVQRLEDLEARLEAIEELDRRLSELEAMLPQLEGTAMKAKRLRAEASRLSAQRAGRPLVQAEDVQGLTRIHAAVRRKVLAYAGKNFN